MASTEFAADAVYNGFDAATFCCTCTHTNLSEFHLHVTLLIPVINPGEHLPGKVSKVCWKCGTAEKKLWNFMWHGERSLNPMLIFMSLMAHLQYTVVEDSCTLETVLLTCLLTSQNQCSSIRLKHLYIVVYAMWITGSTIFVYLWHVLASQITFSALHLIHHVM